MADADLDAVIRQLAKQQNKALMAAAKSRRDRYAGLAAKAMDVLGNKEARIWVSMVKAMVPERAAKIIDQAIQMHGATGISQWTPLAEMYQDVRHLRFADGPDEVHWMVVGRHELSMP